VNGLGRRGAGNLGVVLPPLLLLLILRVLKRRVLYVPALSLGVKITRLPNMATFISASLPSSRSGLLGRIVRMVYILHAHEAFLLLLQSFRCFVVFFISLLPLLVSVFDLGTFESRALEVTLGIRISYLVFFHMVALVPGVLFLPIPFSNWLILKSSRFLGLRLLLSRLSMRSGYSLLSSL
jgi:hypothetical protein